MVAEESPNTPPPAATSNGTVSPQRRQNLPSPWASVVRGDSEQNSSSPPPEQGSAAENPVMESSSPEVQHEISDVNGDSNAGRQRRPAWNRPSNGVVVEAGPVMGGVVSWPALSESTRPIPRSSWSDSTRPVADGSASSSQTPIISQPPQRTTANTNSHSHLAANHAVPTRSRSRNRGGGGGSSSGSGPSQNNFNRATAPMPPPPPFPVFEVAYGLGSPMQDPPVRGARPLGGIGGSQPHTGNDHPSQRSTSRRGGNYGPRPRGDGQYHNNHGGRRDQDRRDVHLPPQYVPHPMGYMPSPVPPGAGPFLPLPPVRVFPGQMGFDVASPFFYVPTMSPESFRAMPLPPPLPSMLFPPMNENLMNSIVKQIDYWFSDDNLVKDNFLRSNMDDHGWVPVSLIASFPRVQQLTKDISEILEALRYSTIVEIQGDKVRRRNDWNRWLKSSGSLNNDSGPRTPGAATENVLAASMQHVSLDDSMTNASGGMEESKGHTDIAAGKISTEETAGQSRLANGEDMSGEAH